MKTGRTVVNVVAFLTFSAILMAAQMQMPASNTGTSKPAEAFCIRKNANRSCQRCHVPRSPYG